jgi:hypothetical protein
MFSINPTASIKKKIVKVRSESPPHQPPAYVTTPDTQVDIYSILKHNRIYKNVLRELIKRTTRSVVISATPKWNNILRMVENL